MDPPPPASRWGPRAETRGSGMRLSPLPALCVPRGLSTKPLGGAACAGSSFHCPPCLGLRGTLREGKKEGEEHGAGDKCQRGLRAQVRPPKASPCPVLLGGAGGRWSAADLGEERILLRTTSKSSLLSDCCWSELGQGERRQSPRPPQPRQTESHVLGEEPTSRGS